MTSRKSVGSTALLNSSTVSGLPGSFLPGKKVEDLRPLRSAGWQNQCKQHLAVFFQEAGFQNFNSKMLSTPTKKDFEAMLRFILITYDPLLRMTDFSSQAYNMVKMLGYPYAVSKTTFDAAGASHTWPQLLGLLDYFVYLVEDFQEEEKLEQTEWASQEAVAQKYSIFLNSSNGERDDRLNEFDENYKKEMALRNRSKVDKLAEELKNKEYLENELERLTKSITPLEVYENHLADVDQEKLHLEEDISQGKSMIKKKLKAKAELERLTESLRTQISVEEAGIIEIREQEKSQLLSAEQHDALVKDTNRIKQETNQVTDRLRKLDESLASADAKIKELIEGANVEMSRILPKLQSEYAVGLNEVLDKHEMQPNTRSISPSMPFTELKRLLDDPSFDFEKIRTSIAINKQIHIERKMESAITLVEKLRREIHFLESELAAANKDQETVIAHLDKVNVQLEEQRQQEIFFKRNTKGPEELRAQIEATQREAEVESELAKTYEIDLENIKENLETLAHEETAKINAEVTELKYRALQATKKKMAALEKMKNYRSSFETKITSLTENFKAQQKKLAE